MNAQTLGEKLKAIRIQKQMTQSEVAGDFITRNMLSQIENGSANPSIKTIEYLAKKLKKPVSYFMDDNLTGIETDSENTGRHLDMAKYNLLLESGNYEEIITQFNSFTPEYLSEYINSEEIIYLLHSAFTSDAQTQISRKNYKEAFALFDSAHKFLKYSIFPQNDLLAEIELIQEELSLYFPVPANDKEFEIDIAGKPEIHLLFQKSLVVSAEKLFTEGNSDICQSFIDSIFDLVINPLDKSNLQYLLAAVMYEQSGKTDELHKKTLGLLAEAQENLGNPLFKIQKTRIFKLIARIYSDNGDYESAYKYLEKAADLQSAYSTYQKYSPSLKNLICEGTEKPTV